MRSAVQIPQRFLLRRGYPSAGIIPPRVGFEKINKHCYREKRQATLGQHRTQNDTAFLESRSGNHPHVPSYSLRRPWSPHSNVNYYSVSSILTAWMKTFTGLKSANGMDCTVKAVPTSTKICEGDYLKTVLWKE